MADRQTDRPTLGLGGGAEETEEEEVACMCCCMILCLHSRTRALHSACRNWAGMTPRMNQLEHLAAKNWFRYTPDTCRQAARPAHNHKGREGGLRGLVRGCGSEIDTQSSFQRTLPTCGRLLRSS
jgi:hypothetical protein